MKRWKFRAARVAAVFAVAVLVSTSVWAQQASDPPLSDATKRLFEAVLDKDIVAVRLSLNDGADIKALNRDGLTAADLAVDNGYFDIAHMILNSRNQPPTETESGLPRVEAMPAPNPETETALPPPPPPPAATASAPSQAANSRLVVNLPSGTSTSVETSSAASAPLTVETTVPAAPAPSTQVATGLPPAIPVDAGRPQPVAPARANWPDGKPNPFEQKAAAPGLPSLQSTQSAPAPSSAPTVTASSPTRIAAAETAEVESEAAAAPESAPGPAAAVKPSSENLMTTGSQVSPVSSARPPEKGPVESFLTNLTTVFTEGAKTEPVVAAGEVQPAPVKVARAPEPAEEEVAKPTPPPPPKPRHVLTNVPLTFGRTEIVGRTPGLDRFDSPDCFRHAEDQAYFCIEDVDWAPEIADKMDISSRLYDGKKTVVRYDHGRATRAFSVFPAKNFADVVAYFEAKFGEPSDREKKRRSLLANRHKPNLILRWESHNESDGRTTILEIRNFDDIRNRIPDTDVSVVRVFDDNSKEIFDTLSDRVFLLRRGAGEFRPGEPTTRTKTLN